MLKIQMQALIGGFLFGIWPILMNMSGLKGNASAASFVLLSFAVVLPFAVREGLGAILHANLWFVVFSGVIGGIGLLAFNNMVADAKPKQLGSLFLMSMMAQIAVPAIYHMVRNGAYEPKKIVGLGLAFAAAWLLS